MDEMEDGTYLVQRDGTIMNYAERWNYGYIVGVQPLITPPPPGTMFGVWTDNKGEKYFDIVEHIATYFEAVKLGRERGEDAIWDLRDSCAIYL